MSRTNYNKMSHRPSNDENLKIVEVNDIIDNEEVSPEVIYEAVDEVEEITPPVEPKDGRVVNCGKLNVRKAPSTNAMVVGTLDVGANVSIEDDSNGDFYKISHPVYSGYCMKKYIAVE